MALFAYGFTVACRRFGLMIDVCRLLNDVVVVCCCLMLVMGVHVCCVFVLLVVVVVVFVVVCCLLLFAVCNSLCAVCVLFVRCCGCVLCVS